MADKSKINPKDSPGLWPLYLSLALISASVLVLEIGFTRIFSVLFEYHYVFLLISLAILGLGAGGIYVHLRIKRMGGLDEVPLLIASGLMALSTEV